MKKVLIIVSIIIVVVFCNCNNSADDPQATQATQAQDSSLNPIDSTAVIDSTKN